MIASKRWINCENHYRHLRCNCMYGSSTWYSLKTPCNTKTKSKDPFTVDSVMKLWTEPRTKPHISQSKMKRGRAVGLITPSLWVSRDENKCCETGKTVWWNTAAIHSSNYRKRWDGLSINQKFAGMRSHNVWLHDVTNGCKSLCMNDVTDAVDQGITSLMQCLSSNK